MSTKPSRYLPKRPFGMQATDIEKTQGKKMKAVIIFTDGEQSEPNCTKIGQGTTKQKERKLFIYNGPQKTIFRKLRKRCVLRWHS